MTVTFSLEIEGVPTGLSGIPRTSAAFALTRFFSEFYRAVLFTSCYRVVSMEAEGFPTFHIFYMIPLIFRTHGSHFLCEVHRINVYGDITC